MPANYNRVICIKFGTSQFAKTSIDLYPNIFYTPEIVKNNLEDKFMDNYVAITNANFDEEVLKSTVPVLLDFWAPWCGPCRMVGPIIEQIAEEYSGRLKVGKINVDDEGDLAGRHGVVSIPTLMVYKDGKIANKTAGALPKQNIEALFKNLL